MSNDVFNQLTSNNFGSSSLNQWPCNINDLVNARADAAIANPNDPPTPPVHSNANMPDGVAHDRTTVFRFNDEARLDLTSGAVSHVNGASRSHSFAPAEHNTSEPFNLNGGDRPMSGQSMSKDSDVFTTKPQPASSGLQKSSSNRHSSASECDTGPERASSQASTSTDASSSSIQQAVPTCTRKVKVLEKQQKAASKGGQTTTSQKVSDGQHHMDVLLEASRGTTFQRTRERLEKEAFDHLRDTPSATSFDLEVIGRDKPKGHAWYRQIFCLVRHLPKTPSLESHLAVFKIHAVDAQGKTVTNAEFPSHVSIVRTPQKDKITLWTFGQGKCALIRSKDKEQDKILVNNREERIHPHCLTVPIEIIPAGTLLQLECCLYKNEKEATSENGIVAHRLSSGPFYLGESVVSTNGSSASSGTSQSRPSSSIPRIKRARKDTEDSPKTDSQPNESLPSLDDLDRLRLARVMTWDDDQIPSDSITLSKVFEDNSTATKEELAVYWKAVAREFGRSHAATELQAHPRRRLRTARYRGALARFDNLKLEGLDNALSRLTLDADGIARRFLIACRQQVESIGTIFDDHVEYNRIHVYTLTEVLPSTIVMQPGEHNEPDIVCLGRLDGLDKGRIAKEDPHYPLVRFAHTARVPHDSIEEYLLKPWHEGHVEAGGALPALSLKTFWLIWHLHNLDFCLYWCDNATEDAPGQVRAYRRVLKRDIEYIKLHFPEVKSQIAGNLWDELQEDCTGTDEMET
ncbi:hypothetical protein OIO90_006176 [Microbotryomycetes sp. JL221]|nr:hypothetical protein OIO90_006176 [Microbotryomycetes sp. JL221]